MQNRDRFKSTIGFTDLLFNLVIGFVFLFILAFLLINPITKKGDVIKKAEFIIVIEWNTELNDDVDLWVRDPLGNTSSFVQKDVGLMNLEKDDLGWGNDTVIIDGIEKVVKLNREVITLRGTVPGTYKIATHIYNRIPHSSTTKGTIRLQVIKVNPYQEVYTNFYEYNSLGQEIPLVNIVIGDDNNFLDFNLIKTDIITNKRSRTERRHGF